MVVNQQGTIIGKVTGVSEDTLQLALGGWYDIWGFLDLGIRRRIDVPARSLAFGPPRKVGYKLVLLPTRG